MSISAADPAGFSYLSPCLVEPANKSLASDNGGEGIVLYLRRTCLLESHCDCSGLPQPVWMRTSSGTCLPFMYPVFRSVRASGPFRRPPALGHLLRIPRPFGVSVPPKTSLRTTAKGAAQTSFGPFRESRPSVLGAGPTRLARPNVTRSTTGKFHKRRHNDVPEQSDPHRISRQQPVSSHKRTIITSRRPNGTVASFSASSRSSPRHSPKERISKWKANCAAGNTSARRRTRSSAPGRFGSLRS